MRSSDFNWYRQDLSRVHHEGFAAHADACAPGILKLLEPVRARGRLVLELGCGSGLLTRHLLRAGHRVLASDASPSMLDLARAYVPDAHEIRRLVLPDDPLPEADAIVSVGHVLSYLPDEAAIERALVAICRALRPGGLFALDLCDFHWGRARRDAPSYAQVRADWAIITQYAMPSAARFVRHITTFVQNDGAWRRDDECHQNVLFETARIPELLRDHVGEIRVTASFGAETLPEGLCVVIGRK
jgi:SAM-dependent methyltransferase